MLVSAAALTVRDVLPETLPRVAEIVVVPACLPVAKPLVPGALLMVAKTSSEEFQTTTSVKSWVVKLE